jgi:uncharacterized protein
VNMAVMLVFLTLQITEIVLAIGFFRVAHGDSAYWVHVGGWCGIVTALVAWYASAAGVVNSLSVRRILPVGGPAWRDAPRVSPLEAPARGREA